MPDDTTDQVVLFVTFQQLDTATTHTTGELYLRKPKRLRPKKRPLTRTEARYKPVSRSATFPPASITKPVWIGPKRIVDGIKARLAADVYLEVFLHADDPFTVHTVGGITPAQLRHTRAYIEAILHGDPPKDGLPCAVYRAMTLAEHAANTATIPTAPDMPPTQWRAPAGYVGSKAIQCDKRFQKAGKNPAASTLTEWVQRTRHNGGHVKTESDPSTHEVYYPEGWISEQIQRWNPRCNNRNR